MNDFNQAQAARCLLCKKPKCSIQGCPLHTPVPECMALYREGKLDEAGEILFRNNPLSAVTSIVCDWKKFCFGNCVLNVKQTPVHWYSVEQEISGLYLRKVTLSRRSEELSNKRIAVVGAGPAGIAASIWLYEAGADVVLFDKEPRIGGVLRYGIPPFRLDKSLVDEYERILSAAGIEFWGGCKVESVEDLLKSYSAVILATGAEVPSTLGIPGEERAVRALEFLRDPKSHDLGAKTIVIGGGNVAMDACRTAKRLGVETWVYYRKTFENMPANPLEVKEAIDEGVEFATFQAPMEIKENGVVFCDCENVVPDGGGRVVTRIIKGTEHFVPCDSLITAVSEKPDISILGGKTLEALPGVYATGDFLLGPRTVVEAVASAKDAVKKIMGE